MKAKITDLTNEEIKKINGGNAPTTSPYDLGVAVGEFIGGVLIAIATFRGVRK